MFTISEFKCPECGNMIPIPRNEAQVRANKHIKDLFCPWCNKIQKTIEYKSRQPIKNMAGEIIEYEYK